MQSLLPKTWIIRGYPKLNENMLDYSLKNLHITGNTKKKSNKNYGVVLFLTRQKHSSLRQNLKQLVIKPELIPIRYPIPTGSFNMRDQDFSEKIDHERHPKLLYLKRVAVDMSNKTHHKDWNLNEGKVLKNTWGKKGENPPQLYIFNHAILKNSKKR